jgi:hypothetical protein
MHEKQKFSAEIDTMGNLAELFGIVALWHCGIVALWHCGIVALWHCGIVALWHCGVVALWRCGFELSLVDTVCIINWPLI